MLSQSNQPSKTSQTCYLQKGNEFVLLGPETSAAEVLFNARNVAFVLCDMVAGGSVTDRRL